MTDLRETVARAIRRVADKDSVLDWSYWGEEADAAIVAVLEPTREWVAKHREAANECAANPNKLFVGTVDNHVGAASACEEILMHIDALIAQHKPGETK